MTPFVVTFYSFKGGVGRTVLAANIAALLAARGKTLLWDLDIEAPGLHRIRDLKSAKANREGFFEWLVDWQQKRKFDAPTPRDLARLGKTCLPVELEPRLFVLPAHGDDAAFARLYTRIDWARFLAYEPERGLALFRSLIDYFGSQGFEYVVIDSRTGITDIGGFLAALLPHVTVLVGNYGVQNTAGLRAIADALVPQVEGKDPERLLPPLRLAMVASPIPQDDPTLVANLRKVWEENFGAAARSLIEIPESPILRLSERILVFDAGAANAEIVARYGQVADRLLEVDAERRAEETAVRQAVAERPDEFPGPMGKGDPESRAAQGKRFEDRVADLLRLLGYRVEPEQTVDGNRVDLIATLKQGLEETVYFVECKDHGNAVGKEVLEKLAVWLGSEKARRLNARGMIVARGFSPAALEFAKSIHLRAFTVEDLERALVDFSPYLNRLVSEFAASPLAKTYVDQMLRPEKAPDQDVPLLPAAAAWALGTWSRLWVVLGDYGTGKTAFTRRFAYDLAQRALGDPDSPVPLLINLKDFSNKGSLADVLHEHWAARTGERRDPALFLHLLQRGRIVLILDSFDEMGVAQAHRNVVEQFRALVFPTGTAGEGPRANRILITCREQFFRDQGEALRAAAGQTDSLAALEQAARGFDGAIDLLPRFSDDQIRAYLGKRLGEKAGKDAWKQIRGIYDLKSLADRPQLLEIIIASLPRLVAAGKAVSAGALYLAYTNEWLDDPQIRPRERLSSSEDLRRILETLARELWRREGQRIHHGDLYGLIKARPELRAGIDPANLDVELRTAAFLSRSPDGYYAFSHRSFLEFFLARAIFRALTESGSDLADVLENANVSMEAVSFVADLLLQNGSEDILDTARTRLGLVLSDAAAPAAARTNAYLLAYWIAVGDLTKVAPNTTLVRSDIQSALRLWLPADGCVLADCDLTEQSLWMAVLDHADLRRSRLDRCDLSDADLSHARLDDASLEAAALARADLRKATGQRVFATKADARWAKFEGGRFPGSRWLGADFANAELKGASFENADLRAAHLGGAAGLPDLAGARLEGATWAGTRARKLREMARPRQPRLEFPWGHIGGVAGVTLSADGRRALSGGDDGTVRLWDLESGRALQSLEGHTGGVSSVALSADGRRALFGGDDGTVRLWDLESGRALQSLEGHRGGVSRVALSADGWRALSGGYDGTVRLWDLEGGVCLAWHYADGDGWFSIDATRLGPRQEVIGKGPWVRGTRDLLGRLCLRDGAEAPGPYPWIPREWPVTDFPEYLHE